jgi:hypothetical protein
MAKTYSSSDASSGGESNDSVDHEMVNNILRVQSSYTNDEDDEDDDDDYEEEEQDSLDRQSPLSGLLRDKESSQQGPNQDAFSSSSDGIDGESGDGSFSSNEERARKASSIADSPGRKKTPQSEWDKVLMTGKASTGKAGDFFTPKQRPIPSDHSASGSEFTAASSSFSPSNKSRLQRWSEIQKRNQTRQSQQQNQQISTAPEIETNVNAKAPEDNENWRSNKDHNIQNLAPPRPSARNRHNDLPSSSPLSSPVSINSKRSLGSTVVRVETNGNISNSNGATDELLASSRSAASQHSLISPTRASYSADTADTVIAGDLSAGVLPDVLMNMRQKIESMGLFDSDMMRLTADQLASIGDDDDDDEERQESRESLKRSSQQSISAAVLVSLAHKRYERRRLAAMEIEKVVRSLVVLQQQSKQPKNELDRVRAILLLLSDDYVRSTNEDARKGGVVRYICLFHVYC